MADQHGFLYDWQTLIAGMLAVGAAVITVGISEGYSRRRERAQTEAIKASLGVEIKAILGVMLEAHKELSGLRGHPQASSVKIATEFPEPAVYRATADRIGLLGEIAPAVTSFYVALDRISIAVRVVTDPPPPRSDISMEPSTYVLGSEDLRKIAGLLEQACRTSLPLLSKLPPGEGDDDLRAKIAAMKPLGDRP
jgi:hypothetical protein